MRAGTQTTISLLFLVGSVIISMVTVQANFPKFLDSFTAPSVLQNFDGTNNRQLNKRLIPSTLGASYKYLAMAAYFNRADVALPGFSKYFRKASDRQLDNANNLMTYINTRGGMLKFRDIRPKINAPGDVSSKSQQDQNSFRRLTKVTVILVTRLCGRIVRCLATLLKGPKPGIVALKTALDIERDLNEEMIAIHKLATKQEDAHLKHILEDHYLEQEVNMIKEYADHLAVLEMMKEDQYGLGEYSLDRNL